MPGRPVGTSGHKAPRQHGAYAGRCQSWQRKVALRPDRSRRFRQLAKALGLFFSARVAPRGGRRGGRRWRPPLVRLGWVRPGSVRYPERWPRCDATCGGWRGGRRWLWRVAARHARLWGFAVGLRSPRGESGRRGQSARPARQSRLLERRPRVSDPATPRGSGPRPPTE